MVMPLPAGIFPEYLTSINGIFTSKEILDFIFFQNSFCNFVLHWFEYTFRYIRRRGNQVQILNRPATVSPMQRFDNSKSHCIPAGMWEGSSKWGQVRRPASAYNF